MFADTTCLCRALPSSNRGLVAIVLRSGNSVSIRPDRILLNSVWGCSQTQFGIFSRPSSNWFLPRVYPPVPPPIGLSWVV
eukprot:1114414-Pyramimonas_sp.AAC.2